MLGIFLDTETNGLDPFRHVVLEIALIVRDLVTGETRATYCAALDHPEETWQQSDPASLAVNGLRPGLLPNPKKPESVAREIIELFDRLDVHRKRALFICQNPSFDRVFFSQLISSSVQEEKQWPYHWLDLASMYFALGLKAGEKPWEGGLSKDSIALSLGLDREAAPHRALQGTEHLIACYDALLKERA